MSVEKPKSCVSLGHQDSVCVPFTKGQLFLSGNGILFDQAYSPQRAAHKSLWRKGHQPSLLDQAAQS